MEASQEGIREEVHQGNQEVGNQEAYPAAYPLEEGHLGKAFHRVPLLVAFRLRRDR
jgi:hypothetical protein